jgi:hypothetical protein
MSESKKSSSLFLKPDQSQLSPYLCIHVRDGILWNVLDRNEGGYKYFIDDLLSLEDPAGFLNFLAMTKTSWVAEVWPYIHIYVLYEGHRSIKATIE